MMYQGCQGIFHIFSRNSNISDSMRKQEFSNSDLHPQSGEVRCVWESLYGTVGDFCRGS